MSVSVSVRAWEAGSQSDPAVPQAQADRRPPAHADSRPAARITLDHATDPVEWNRLAAQPGATPFHGWEWLSWIAPQLSCEFVPLKVVHGGEAVGVAPLLLRRRWGLASANIVPFSYLGPLVPVELVSATSYALLRWARNRRVVSMELCLNPGLPAADDALGAAGFDEERVDTFVVDLAGYDESELFSRLGGDARTAVRRSVKRGVSVRTSTPEDLRQVLPAVHVESLGAACDYAALIGEAVASGTLPVPARCATAVVDGRPVGVSITLGGAPSAVGWLGAVHRADQYTQANAALFWDAISWAAREGHVSMDMCGAPDPGIATFKRKFRPRIETHLVGRWSSPVLAAVRRLRSSGD